MALFFSNHESNLKCECGCTEFERKTIVKFDYDYYKSVDELKADLYKGSIPKVKKTEYAYFCIKCGKRLG